MTTTLTRASKPLGIRAVLNGRGGIWGARATA
jgi:hypothetical protein